MKINIKLVQRLGFLIIFLCMSGLYNSTVVFAQATRVPDKIIVPKDLASTKISLLTVGLGEELYMRYGHTLLRIETSAPSRVYVYNWGMFSFDDPMFAFNFFLGERKYWVGETKDWIVNKLYKQYEDRSVFEQTINLTDKQKLTLIQTINRSLNPEDIYFNYEHFTSNCSTKPRDFLDVALGGYIKQSLAPQTLEVTYRDYVVTNMNKPPFLGFILDIGMNSKLEKVLTKWDETFYPPKLSEHLSALPAIDDDGAVMDHPLLGPRVQWVQASSEHISSDFKFAQPFALCFLGVLALCFVLLLVKKSSAVHSFLFKSAFAVFSLCWGLFSGGLGLFMLLSWAVSTHLDMHHNVNLLLFFVFDIAYIWLALAALRGRLVETVSKGFFTLLIYAHFICAGVFIAGRSFGWFEQDVSTAFYYLMPIQLLYSYLLFNLYKIDRLKSNLRKIA